MKSDNIRQQYREFLFPAVTPYYEDPVVLAEGHGCKVKDLDGKEYLDFFGGILTISLGHSNEEVNQAVIAQLGRLTHVSTLYPTLPIVELAAKLAHITPDGLQKSFFVASGTEANETAIMIAQLYTHNLELIALSHSYSGRSLLAQSLAGLASWKAIPSQVAGITHVPSPYCYRCPLKLTYPTCGIACADQIEEAIKTSTSGRVAAMIAEPIQGVGGFITPPKEYFEKAVEIIHKYEGVFIADEVQTGFGRTGKMWGFEQFNIEPDIMTLAKGIANGFPIGAVITTPAIADSLQKPSISTFGGNPISSTAANTTIDIILRENLIENAQKMGQLLREGLCLLKTQFPTVIGDIRGMGLMQGVELVVDETTQDRTPNAQFASNLLEETKKRGLLIGKGGLYGHILRIAPPLSIQKNDIEHAIEILADSFATLTK